MAQLFWLGKGDLIFLGREKKTLRNGSHMPFFLGRGVGRGDCRPQLGLLKVESAGESPEFWGGCGGLVLSCWFGFPAICCQDNWRHLKLPLSFFFFFSLTPPPFPVSFYVLGEGAGLVWGVL